MLSQSLYVLYAANKRMNNLHFDSEYSLQVTTLRHLLICDRLLYCSQWPLCTSIRAVRAISDNVAEIMQTSSVMCLWDILAQLLGTMTR